MDSRGRDLLGRARHRRRHRRMWRRLRRGTTVTVSRTTTTPGETVTETSTETVSATKAEKEKLKEQAAALAARKSDLNARARTLEQKEKALQKEIGVVRRTSFSDGTFLVGKEVAPGTYRARGGGDCYWARLSGFGGSDIIVNGGFTRNQTVTVSSSDKGFESSGCGTWHRIG